MAQIESYKLSFTIYYKLLETNYKNYKKQKKKEKHFQNLYKKAKTDFFIS